MCQKRSRGACCPWCEITWLTWRPSLIARSGGWPSRTTCHCPPVSAPLSQPVDALTAGVALLKSIHWRDRVALNMVAPAMTNLVGFETREDQPVVQQTPREDNKLRLEDRAAHD